MRSFINVISSNDLVGVIARVSVVAKRNVAKLQDALRALHLYLRRPHASAGYSFSMFGTMQPARATATPVAAAAASRREPWGCPASRPSTRLG